MAPSIGRMYGREQIFGCRDRVTGLMNEHDIGQLFPSQRDFQTPLAKRWQACADTLTVEVFRSSPCFRSPPPHQYQHLMINSLVAGLETIGLLPRTHANSLFRFLVLGVLLDIGVLTWHHTTLAARHTRS